MNQSMNQRDMFFKWLYYAGAVLLLVLVFRYNKKGGRRS